MIAEGRGAKDFRARPPQARNWSVTGEIRKPEPAAESRTASSSTSDVGGAARDPTISAPI